MKITFVLPYAGLSGGIRVIAHHAQGLKNRGHDVLLISSPYRHPRRRDRIMDRIHHGWKRLRGQPLPSHLNDVDVPWSVLDRPREVINGDVPNSDVVIATYWRTVGAVAALAPEKGAKVFFIQGYETHGTHDPADVDRVWTVPMFRIAVSQWLAEAAARRCSRSAVALVPNAVDTSLFQAPPRNKQRKPTVGFIYDAKPYRGCDIVIEAIRLARLRVPDLCVRSFGVEKPDRTLPLPDGTQYTVMPPQVRLPSLYAMCDVWLLGSREEGFGLPILEAMACRTPVISTPAGAAPQLLASGGGVLVPAEDPAVMAAAIHRIVTLSDDHWRRFSDQALAQAASYTWDEATSRFEAALVQACLERDRPPLVNSPVRCSA